MGSKGAGKVWDHQNEALPVRAITILPLFPPNSPTVPLGFVGDGFARASRGLGTSSGPDAAGHCQAREWSRKRSGHCLKVLTA